MPPIFVVIIFVAIVALAAILLIFYLSRILPGVLGGASSQLGESAHGFQEFVGGASQGFQDFLGGAAHGFQNFLGVANTNLQAEANREARKQAAEFARLRTTDPDKYYDIILAEQVSSGQIGNADKCTELRQLAGRAASRGAITDFRRDKAYAKSLGCAWAQ